MSMEMGQAVRYTLSQGWEKEGTVWPQGSIVYVVPLTPQPDETMVDVFLTDRAEDATRTGDAPRFQTPSAALFIEDGQIRLRRDEDELHP
jgi:hypothetical protein